MSLVIICRFHYRDPLIAFQYFVITSTGVLESDTELSVNTSDLIEAVSSVPVSGFPDQFYEDRLYEGETSNLINKDTLCHVTLNQVVPERRMREFEQLLAKCWTSLNPGGVLFQ